MYLSVDLTEPLVAGQQYCLGLWMNLAEQSSFRTSTLHAFLWYGHPSMCNGNDSLWDDNAVLTFNTSEVDTAGWTLLEGSFTASGAEANLTLGSFLFGDEIDTTFLDWHLPPYTASYYVDDVYLGSCDGIGMPEPKPTPPELTLYPNPAPQGSEVRLSFDEAQGHSSTLSLFNMAGQCLMSKALTTDCGVLSTNRLAQGSYVVVATNSLQKSRGLLVIQ